VKVTATEENLPGVRMLEFEPFTDERGFFYETYNRRTFAGLSIDLTFVQDNHSRSRRDVIRGLHYQGPGGPQWRLVRCPVGEIYDVIVDLQVGSPTFGQWMGYTLSAQNMRQLLIPPAYAHGFAVISEVAEVQYKCSGLHDGEAERALSFADPDLGITWPVSDPITSLKDGSASSWQDYLADPAFPEGWAHERTANR
jgi:dTDP-4-dehydrorhamnose 3,5-epimerase